MSTAWAVLFMLGGVNHLCAPVWIGWFRESRARRRAAVASVSAVRPLPYPRPVAA